MSARLLPVQRFAALFLTVLVTTVALMATSVVVASDADAASKRKIKHAMKVAKNQKGDPYSYGADGPNAFDCSGLFYFAFQKRTGVNVPRTSSDQYRYMRKIKKENMQRGDLMFFRSGGSVYHVGMFLRWKDGKRVLLHSPNSGSTVHRTQVWTRQWKPATMRGR